jgi:ABC-type transport system involved in cytochrome bd biosynthesis fused ATPase/permease subunit
VVQSVVVPPLVLLWVARTVVVSLVALLVTLPSSRCSSSSSGWRRGTGPSARTPRSPGLAATLLDLLQGLPTLKVHGRAQGQVAAVARVAERHRIETVRALRWAFLSGFALDLIATLSVALVALTAGLRLQDGALALAPALVVLLLAPEVFVPLRAVGAQYHASTDALEAAAVALELAALPALQVRGTLLAGEPVASLVDVTVRHPRSRRGRPARREPGAVAGQVVAVEGPSGAGKSTLLHVLLGAVGRTPGRW